MGAGTAVQHRSVLIGAAMTTQTEGFAERDARVLLLVGIRKRDGRRITVGAGKAYDTKDYVFTPGGVQITPPVWRNTANPRSVIDGRTRRHPGYAISLSKRRLGREAIRTA
jgi:hypothetical protein